MRTSFALALSFFFVVVGSACGPSAGVKICLSDEGNSQDCGIACDVTKDEKACAKWEKLTVTLCDKVGKEKCQEVCEADKNKYACDKAKSM